MKSWSKHWLKLVMDVCIFRKINGNLDKPNADVKVHAPKIIMRTIPGNFIGALIGPGGKVIQELQKATGTTIVINEVDEQGVVEILEQIQMELQQY
jgi:polyribonucleotide nucleotidyltransferase